MTTSSGKEFEIAREFEVDASPVEVWDALTTGAGGWLWPMRYEPREGGAAPFGGTVTRWDPPHRLTGRVEGPEGLPDGQVLNQLDQTIEPRDGGRRSWVRYVHSGVFTDDWANQYDGASKHTDFYLHTLRQYLTHFTGRTATFTTLEGPPSAKTPDAFIKLGRHLGLPDDAREGARVRVDAPGGSLDAVVDFRTSHFIGLRTDTALYRFFGRNRFGAPVAVSVHDFAAHTDPKGTELAWRDWLDRLYA
ncbi:SRPBCC domain-containing protein [Streptomyces sp. NPDC021622]|uniref:SRPBCC family protein n=1 Tax=Streptomyces sp. NPDC021622 TaxID=3155013 RepID=UPI003407483D